MNRQGIGTGSSRAFRLVKRLLLTVGFSFGWALPSQAQFDSSAPSQGLPFMNAGPDSGFAQLDFAQMYLDQQNKRARLLEQEKLKNQKLIDGGVISALDLGAPNNAIQQFNLATSLLKQQNSKGAAKCLEKAIHIYPKFVSAHNALGLAYQDHDDPRAKTEFEEAAHLDTRFPGSFLNLGLLALSQKDFAAAETNLDKAAALNPQNAKILSALAFAENGNHHYSDTLKTTARVHSLDHRGMANVHYIAAAASLTMNDRDDGIRELTQFLNEDPTNPLAPTARRNLEILEKQKLGPVAPSSRAGQSPASETRLETFPNSDRLKQQLNAVGEESASNCEGCTTPDENLKADGSAPAALPSPPSPAVPTSTWTIRTTVDETAVFFAVSHRGHMVNDLALSDIRIRDDNKAPERVLEFLPQSKLPLRLGLIIDTSGSVQGRFSFEKRAAAKFLEKVLNGGSDLGFVAGFNSETSITQDFTAAPRELGTGIEQLKNGGGTSLFDAVSLACLKLADYPERERVAKVLVILSDGEDNSSHRSLKQTIEDAETSGVTIYTVSTKEDSSTMTDADKILDVLAERSGGESMFPGDISALDKTLEKLRDLIRSRYLLAYKPAGFAPNGKYRTIHLTAEKNGRRLEVHTRKGYYARLEPTHN